MSKRFRKENMICSMGLCLLIFFMAGSAAAQYTLTEGWTTTNGDAFFALSSIVYDAASDKVLVADQRTGGKGSVPYDGVITRLNSSGTVDTYEWIGVAAGVPAGSETEASLDGPRDMLIQGTTLVVAEQKRIVNFTAATAAFESASTEDPLMSAKGGNVMRGIAMAANGDIYAAASGGNAIYRLASGATDWDLAAWLIDGDNLVGPHKLVVESDRLVVALAGGTASDGVTTVPGGVSTVALSDKAITSLYNTGPALAITPDGAGNYFFLGPNSINLLESDGTVTELLALGLAADLTEGDLLYAAGIDKLFLVTTTTVYAYDVSGGGGPICTDADSDGYYAESGCGTAVDCDDGNAAVNPGATENCSDVVDNDCDGDVDCADSDCSGDPACITCTDADSDGYFAENGCGTEVDCDDSNADVNPGAEEVADDGIDNDCDGEIDEKSDGGGSDSLCFISTLLK